MRRLVQVDGIMWPQARIALLEPTTIECFESLGVGFRPATGSTGHFRYAWVVLDDAEEIGLSSAGVG